MSAASDLSAVLWHLLTTFHSAALKSAKTKQKGNILSRSKIYVFVGRWERKCNIYIYKYHIRGGEL